MLKNQLKVIGWLAVITCLTFFIPTMGLSDYGAAKSSLSTDNGLAEISRVRRTLRGACDKLKSIDGKEEHRAALLRESAVESRQALLLWQELRKSYSENAPSVYAQNPDWSRSADEIEQTIRQMIDANLNGDSKKAFASCGQTCRNFIAMNEKAGIELTTDILFQFRKDAKLLMPSVRENDSAKTDAVVKSLLNLRDRALANPVDGTGAPVKDRQALQTFSEAVSALAVSIQSADKNVLSDRYSKMMSAMETAYDLYL
jgi:hypothetical protein